MCTVHPVHTIHTNHHSGVRYAICPQKKNWKRKVMSYNILMQRPALVYNWEIGIKKSHKSGWFLILLRAEASGQIWSLL